MFTIDYLDLAKRLNQLPSDYALAGALGVTPQSVSGWRSGRSVPEPLICVRLAALVRSDPLEVIGNLEIEKAEKRHRSDTADAWRSILRRTSAAAAMVLMGAVINSPDTAHARGQVNNKSAEYTS